MVLRRFILLILFVAGIVAAPVAAVAVYATNPVAASKQETKAVLKALDARVEDNSAAETAKLRHIAEIHSRRADAGTDDEKYEILDRLYAEYYQYDIDSAIFYAVQKLELARQLSENTINQTAGQSTKPTNRQTAPTKTTPPSNQSTERFHDAIFDLADRYVLSGMYVEAMNLMKDLDINEVDPLQQPTWCHVYKNIYAGLEAGCNEPGLRQQYSRKKKEYRRMLCDRLGGDDISRLYVETEIKLENNRGSEVVQDLRPIVDDPKRSMHEKAVVHYIIAQAYAQIHDYQNAILYLAKSAIHDLETPVKEYKALYELASLLHKEGDAKRAYKYIIRSVSDALAANARLNIQSINTLLPLISRANSEVIRHNQTLMILFLTGISILAIALVIAGAYTWISKKKVARANAKLSEYVVLLKESNSLKENYIGQYLDMCSYYIGGLERYRSRLRKIARDKGFAAVTESLKSMDFIDKELEDFYKRFDATFLEIFPDFVRQLNSLLQPDQQIENKSKSGLLSTELRVAALIRLGVTDSDKIAYFLRRSVSTIYNYRVKMRNAALSDREDFEKQIMKIGML